MVGWRVPLWAAGLICMLAALVAPHPSQAQDAPATPPPAEPPAAEAPPAQPPAEAPAAPAPETAPAQPPAEAPAAPAPEAAPAAPAPAEPPAPATPEAPAAPAEPEAPAAPEEGAAAGDAEATDAADEELVPEDEAEDDGVEEIIVTGSRIKRTSFSAAAPVQVVSREQLEFSGAQNLGEVIRHLSAAGGSDFAGRGLGLFGTTQISLRGLGTQATLILINGRRVVPAGAVSISGSGVGSVVDIGQVPVTAIERIEILQGGASAIYGSDAVAGVINVITVKDYNGVKAEVGAQSTDRFDHAEYQTSLLIGAASERTRANVSVVYTTQDRLGEDERDWTAVQDFNRVGNPATFVLDPTAPGYLANPRPSDLPSADLEPGVHADPQCEDAPYTELNEEGFCTFDSRPFDDLMPAREQFSLLGYSEYDLTDYTKIFLEAGVRNMQYHSAVVPSLPVLQPVFVPWDHVDNPWGQTVQYFGATQPVGEGRDLITADDTTMRIALGLQGKLEDAAANTIAEDWEWDITGTWGRSNYRLAVPDTVTDRLQAALDSCSDPNDLSGCFNPFYSSLGTDPDNAGTPNSREVLHDLQGAMLVNNNSWLTTAGAGMTGGLLELPGGDLQFALGGQWRRESRTSDLDHDATNLRYGFTYGNSDARASRDIVGGYLELLWPFYDGIELTTAGRIEHYERSGEGVSPAAGLTVHPAEIVGRDTVVDALRRLELRGQITRAFRAPSVYTAFPGSVTSFEQFDQEGPTPAVAPVRRFGNPDLEPETALVFSAGFSWSPIDELALTMDYWNYDYDERIASENAQQIYAADRFDERVRRDEAGGLLGVDVMALNAEFVRTDGIDFGAILLFDVADDTTLSIGGQGTFVNSFEIPVEAVPMPDDEGTPHDCDSESCDVAGSRNFANFAEFNSKLRMNMPVTFKSGEHALSATGRFMSGLVDDGAPKEGGGFHSMPATFTLDFTYGYTFEELIGKSTTLRLGVLNLFDLEPPTAGSTNRYSIAIHDPRGRLIYVKLTQEL